MPRVPHARVCSPHVSKGNATYIHQLALVYTRATDTNPYSPFLTPENYLTRAHIILRLGNVFPLDESVLLNGGSSRSSERSPRLQA